MQNEIKNKSKNAAVSKSSRNELKYASLGLIPVERPFMDFLKDNEKTTHNSEKRENLKEYFVLLEPEKAESMIKQNKHRIGNAENIVLTEALNVIKHINLSKQYSNLENYSCGDFIWNVKSPSDKAEEGLLYDFCNNYASHEVIDNHQKNNLSYEVSRSADIFVNLPIFKKLTRLSATRKINQIIQRKLDTSSLDSITITQYHKALDIARTTAVTELFANLMGIHKTEDSRNKDDSA
jgi:hypothetical protein